MQLYIKNIHIINSKFSSERRSNASKLLNNKRSLIFDSLDDLIEIASFYTHIPAEYLYIESPGDVLELMISSYLKQNYSYTGSDNDPDAVDIVEACVFESHAELLCA